MVVPQLQKTSIALLLPNIRNNNNFSKASRWFLLQLTAVVCSELRVEENRTGFRLIKRGDNTGGVRSEYLATNIHRNETCQQFHCSRDFNKFQSTSIHQRVNCIKKKYLTILLIMIKTQIKMQKLKNTANQFYFYFLTLFSFF